jgi:uncharacterized protein (TIGR02145 family)
LDILVNDDIDNIDMKTILKYVSVCVFLALGLLACEQEELPPVIDLQMEHFVIEPSYEDVTFTCKFRTVMTIEYVTVYLDTNLDFSDALSLLLTQESIGTYTGSFTHLSDGTTYYMRYKVYNTWSELLLDEIIEFTTIPITSPIMEATTVEDITFNSATIKGNILSAGGKQVLSCGIVYGTTSNPTFENATQIQLAEPAEHITCTIGNLLENTQYYARIYAVNEIGVSYGDQVTFTVDPLWSGFDLGLSVKWAHINLGATTPWDNGDYFAWGETSPDDEYNWRYYQHCYEDPNYITKYAPYVDGKQSLDPEDDAATVNWGTNWRMPTKNEWNELREQCDWKWMTQNNVCGYQITSKNNGRSIFLPAAGQMGNTNLLHAGSVGCYWSKNLDTKHNALALRFDTDDQYLSAIARYYGLPIRPVSPK